MLGKVVLTLLTHLILSCSFSLSLSLSLSHYICLIILGIWKIMASLFSLHFFHFQELQTLRVAKVTGGAAAKLAKMWVSLTMLPKLWLSLMFLASNWMLAKNDEPNFWCYVMQFQLLGSIGLTCQHFCIMLWLATKVQYHMSIYFI